MISGPHHIETSQLIGSANYLISFYMMGNILRFLVKGLSQIQNVLEKFEKRETAIWSTLT